jgi:hypothetical protein
MFKNPAFQAAEENGISSASCASLACGYGDKARRAAGEFDCNDIIGDIIDNQNHKKSHKSQESQFRQWRR